MTKNDLKSAEVLNKSFELLDSMTSLHSKGEDRPQQRDMVEQVSNCINNKEHGLIQAGTGVGKSLGYLIPLVASGKKAVVSTATNQLSEQLSSTDMPFLSTIVKENGGKPISFSILKGRANYVCLSKINNINSLEASAPASHGTQDALFSDLDSDVVRNAKLRGKETTQILEWVKSGPKTGDITEAPRVSSETWRTVSSTNAECPGKQSCPFARECYAEIARDKARNSQIVVTNHALTASHLSSTEDGILGNREVFVFDELHELDGYLSDAWGTQISRNLFKDTHKAIKNVAHLLDKRLQDELNNFKELGVKLFDALQELDFQSFDNMEDDLPEIYSILSKVRTSVNAFIGEISSRLSSKDSLTLSDKYKLALNLLSNLDDAIGKMFTVDVEQVKWIEKEEGRDTEARSLKTAPLRVGPLLMSYLEDIDATMVGTSATITVGGQFDIPARNLSLGEDLPRLESPRNFITKDVGTPFDYPKQAILYIPKPDSFPAPVGAEREEHSAAVLKTLVKLVKAAGGRTLALSTTNWGAKKMAETLRESVKTPVISHLDGPVGQIVDDFTNNEAATLCATMGLWHGLNVPGPSLSLVVIDKIPFAPMNDPLSNARQKDANERGLNGFMDVYVASANVMLAQGFGRLIRHTTDLGGVAILDTRLLSKPYGRKMLKSLPNAYFINEEKVFLEAIKRLSLKYETE